jgi:hypothetical protein
MCGRLADDALKSGVGPIPQVVSFEAGKPADKVKMIGTELADETSGDLLSVHCSTP